MVGGKKSAHIVKANVKEFSKNALSATNRAIQTTISNYTPFISASLMNASTAAFDVSKFAKENNPLARNKNRDPYVRRAINRASDAFQTSINELRQGHLSFEETRNEISEYINENSESEWDSMAASADGETGGAGGGSQKQFSVSDYVKGVAASSRSNVRALQVTTNKITESQYKSLNLATSKIVSSNMANMQAITRQFSVTNSRIENVNANIVNLVQFNNTTVSEYFAASVAHMGKMETYLEEMVAYARLDNEKRINHYSGTGSKYRSRRQEEDSKDFLSYGFDTGKYAKSIIDNLMETAFGPTVLSGVASGIKAIFGKVPAMLADFAAGSLGDFIQQFNPMQLVVEKFMPSLKGFNTIDEIVQTTITSFFSQLGSGTYNGPFSEIARLFGIKGSTANIDRSDYNHGEAPWTGEDSRALKQVIPDYLSTIELRMTNMVDQSIINTNAMIDAIKGVQDAVVLTSGKNYGDKALRNLTKIESGVIKTAVNNRRLYDYEAGDFTTENKIIDKLRASLQRSTSMYYDNSKKVVQELLRYADSGKMSSSSNKKALSDALTEIFMNFNAVDGETALTDKEITGFVNALIGLGINTESKDVKDLISKFTAVTQDLRLNVNRDVGQPFQQMRNLGLGASTNDIATDVVNHNRDVIESFKNTFTLESILRTLDDELDNFADFKRTDAYKSMDNETKRAYEQAVKSRNSAYKRQGIIAAMLNPDAFVNNPFNVVAGTVVNSTEAVAVSLRNVVTGVSTFSDELKNITETIRDASIRIKSFMVGGKPDLGGYEGSYYTGALEIDKDKVVKVHKGEIILNPELSERVRGGIADFINGNIDEDGFNKRYSDKLTKDQVEEIKFVKKALQSAGKIKVKTLSDVSDQIWDAGKYIDKAPNQTTRIELFLAQIARNQEVGLLADNIGAVGESDRDTESMDANKRDHRLQTLRHGIGKINNDGLFEGGMLSDFANSVKGTYDKVINSLVGTAYNTYEVEDGQKKLVHHEENQQAFLKRYKKWLVGRAESVAGALGMSDKNKENISKTFDFIGENGHKLVIGGIAGLIANMILPISCGPLVGISAAMINSSKTLNNRLFGTKDEKTGKRADDGLISTKVTNFIKENMFSLVSGGIAGMKIMKSGPVSSLLGAGANKFVSGLVGLIPGEGGIIGRLMQGAVGVAFGPVGGALLGMGIAAMSQSEHVKKFLFGEEDRATGKRSGGVLGEIKGAFTNLGNAVKEKIFGKDVEYTDANGRKVKRKDGSGLLNRFESAIYAHVLRPITTSAKYIGKYFMLWFKDDVLNSTKRIIYPITIKVNEIAESIRPCLADTIHKHIDGIKDAFKPVTKAISTISTKLARATLSGVENIVKISLKSVSAPLKIASGILGIGKAGKPGLGAKLFMGAARGKVNRMMFFENLRLFGDELFGGGKKQHLLLDNTMTGKKKDGTAKDGLKEKLIKYLDRNEKLFGHFRAIGDIFKALGNTSFGIAIKSVLNVLTHPFNVIIKNIAEGAMAGLKALVTAPFTILGLPLKGIKWVGNKIAGKESRLGKAIANFKERAEVIKNNGSAVIGASELTHQFAKTFNGLNWAITKRTEQDGLLKPGQQQLIDAKMEHKRLKADKKALERQHKKDKALDSYISKLNLTMSPAEFDALPADKRNKIIATLARKSGNKDIYNWDNEKLRALVTGGRGKVEKFELKQKEQDSATKNIVNLPDTLKSNTEKITDKLQDVVDAITGKKTEKSAEKVKALPVKTTPGETTGETTTLALPEISKNVQSVMKTVLPDIGDTSFGNGQQREQEAHELLRKMAGPLGIDLESLGKDDKKNLIKGLKLALKGGDNSAAIANVSGILTNISKNTKGPSKLSGILTGMTNRIKDHFAFDRDSDTVTAPGKGKYTIDSNGKLVAAKKEKNSSGKIVSIGNYNLTIPGRFKKWVRDKRDGTNDAFDSEGNLNVDGMSWSQNLIARLMLGKGWRDKKSKGELNRDKEMQMTSLLKMLSGSGKVKLITSIIGKVIKGLAGTAVFMAGIGLFMTKLWPVISNPIKKILFGDPDNPRDGLFGFINGLWTDHIKPGISAAFKTGVQWMFGDPNNPDDNGAIGKALTWIGTNLPDLVYTGLSKIGDLAALLYNAVKDGTTDVFIKNDPFNLIDKGKEEVNEKAYDTVFNSSVNDALTLVDEKTGETKKYNVNNSDGTINVSEFKRYMTDSGYGVNALQKEKNKYEQIRALLEQQANWGINPEDGYKFTAVSSIGRTSETKQMFKSLKGQVRQLSNDQLDLEDGLYVAKYKVDDAGHSELVSIYKAKYGDELCEISKIPTYRRIESVDANGNTVFSNLESNPEFENNNEYVYEGSSLGYGVGHFTQSDPRWGRLGYGKMRGGRVSTMANGGCGPTALANVMNNAYGRNVTNPISIAKYAAKNGYSVDGGTSAGLFSKGVKALGLASEAVGKGVSSLTNALRNGKQLIVAGKGGNAYTGAGHIMSVRGLDRRGNAIVDDPMRVRSRHIPLRSLSKGMTHAWSIGRGPGSDVYFGTSPDGSNYAMLTDFYSAIGSNSIPYYDTTTGNLIQLNESSTYPDANNGSIIWGYANGSYDASCFVKSIASAVYNLYAKKRGFDRAGSEQFISQMSKSIAQPHTIQSTGSYGANTNGYVTDYNTLANSIYSGLNSIESVDSNGISLIEGRDLDPTSQKSTILSNLTLGKPVVVHINSANFPEKYRQAVFGKNSSGYARSEHAVLLNGLVKSGATNYVMIGDPGSAQASGGNLTSGAQIRLVNFDQLTDPLAKTKLNHLLTINDGSTVPLLDVTSPNINNVNAAMGYSSSSGSGNELGTSVESTESKGKFASFTEWLAGLVKQAAKVGSALLSAIFSGKSFKEIWAEMNVGEGGTGAYTYNSTNSVYSPTTYLSNASDEYKSAFEMVARYDNDPTSRGIHTSNINVGHKYINYDSKKYMADYGTDADAGRFSGGKITSKFAEELLGLAVYYIKNHTPLAIDTNFKKYCILVANLLSRTVKVNAVYNDYKNGKILFKDIDGICMFAALCFEKLLLSDRDADKCYRLFMNAIASYTEAGGKFGDESEGSVGFGGMDLSYYSEGKAKRDAIKKQAKQDMITAAKNAAAAAYKYMTDNLLVMTQDEARRIISQQSQVAQVGEYGAMSSYTGDWAPTNQPWVDDPIYINNRSLINSYAKPSTNYDSATSGISSTYQPGYFRPGFSTIQIPNYSQYARQLTRDLRTFPTISVDKMNQVIKSVAPHSAFVGHGQTFINASNMTGLDPLYIFSQTWESGFGTSGRSHLTKGNYHGLVAYESDHASSFLNNGVPSIDSGIMGGAQILSKYYINRDYPHQNNILSLCDVDHCYNNETSDYANKNASYLAQAEAAAGFGIGGNGGVNIHDAMMNTPTSDIYTRDDDIYMGDAAHPMNVKMDTTPTTSRLDVIISLLSEILKGDDSLPPATTKATESVAGYGEGKGNSSKTPIIIANQQKKVDKANTNLKRDRLRTVYDRISKRALTYTH